MVTEPVATQISMSIAFKVLGGFLAVILALIGVLYRVMTGRINKLECNRVHVKNCDLRHEKYTSELEHLKTHIADIKKDNQDDHGKIDQKMETIFSILQDIKDCVTRLSVGGKDC